MFELKSHLKHLNNSQNTTHYCRIESTSSLSEWLKSGSKRWFELKLKIKALLVVDLCS
jgi:hypothetical protein